VFTADTNAIKSATATLRKDYYTQPESLPFLVKIVATHHNANIRQLAAVEARNLVPAFWPDSESSKSELPDNVKAEIRSSLLQSTVNEPEALPKHSAARLISAIAKIDLPQNQWLELPQFLHEAAVSAKALDREIGVFVLYTLLETLEGQFSDRWADFFTLFGHTINDQESLQVRVYTLLALGKMAEFLDVDEDPDSVRSFKGLLPNMVSVLKDTIEHGDDDQADQVFDVFMNLLSSDPSLTANHFKDLVQFMMQLAPNENLSDDIRQKVLNFLIACVRLRKMKIQSMKIGETLTLLALKIAADSDEEDPDDESTLPKAAILLINFLAEALPPSHVVVPLMHNLGTYATSNDANHRRAAITALGACVEGAPDFVATQIHHIVPLVTKLLTDPEQQVRRATLLTLANLADELGEEIAKFHAEILPLLINMLDSNDGLEIWKSSCHAIDALLDEVDTQQVQAYLPTLMPRLSAMFTQEDLKLKAAAVGGISSTARGAKETFQPYFEETMAALSPYLTVKESEEEINLRSVVMDCMGSIAEAIGAEAFTPYVNPLMESAKEALHLGNSRIKETAFYFFAVLARVYKEEFSTFLPSVMPSLFESLEQSETEMDGEEIDAGKVMISNLGGTELDVPIELEDLDTFDEDDDWEELAAVTAVALEKEVAIDSIGEILAHCTNGFLPYLEKTVEILVDKTQHMYEGVRKSAIDSLWRAYAALWQVQGDQMAKWEPGLPLKVTPTKELVHLGTVVINCTLALWKEEEDREVVTAIGHNIGEVLKMCGPAILSDNDGHIILELITQLQLVLSKTHPCQLEAAEDGGLMVELGESSEYDWVLIESALDCVLGLAAALGPAFGDAWKIVGQSITKYASSTESIERSHAVGIIADSVRYMGKGCTQHTSALMKLLLHRLSDEDAETKSNAAYATGLLCQNSEANDEIVKNYPAILTKLEPLLHTSGHRILDNACGCVARMIMAHENAVGPLEQILGALTGLLPLKEDFEENEPIYMMFVQLCKF